MKGRDSEVSCLPAGSGRDSHPPGMLHQRYGSISVERAGCFLPTKIRRKPVESLCDDTSGMSLKVL